MLVVCRDRDQRCWSEPGEGRCFHRSYVFFLVGGGEDFTYIVFFLMVFYAFVWCSEVLKGFVWFLIRGLWCVCVLFSSFFVCLFCLVLYDRFLWVIRKILGPAPGLPAGEKFLDQI